MWKQGQDSSTSSMPTTSGVKVKANRGGGGRASSAPGQGLGDEGDWVRDPERWHVQPSWDFLKTSRFYIKSIALGGSLVLLMMLWNEPWHWCDTPSAVATPGLVFPLLVWIISMVLQCEPDPLVTAMLNVTGAMFFVCFARKCFSPLGDEQFKTKDRSMGIAGMFLAVLLLAELLLPF